MESMQTTIGNDLNVTVEYNIEWGQPQIIRTDPNDSQPGYDDEIDILSVCINGFEDMDIADDLSAQCLNRIEAECMAHYQKMAKEARDERDSETRAEREYYEN